ncbi:hypothetical protein POF50_012220 [Streptomyces sp. SL13]|uniref:Uncharacterized protein n=1 Tax=Streptantibioticus silvisoli TaxID=2705255 RepID=A0AA90H2F8_9ACTN|nr:hypothetical protein [Streptantibioticus silvisoli]MDI5970096.1 hypothetical protein [Streptantibioticus silvisoli]
MSQSSPRMNTSIKGNVISGLIALAIYVVIALATGDNPGAAIGVGVGLGVVVFLLSFAISRTIRANRAR